MNIDTYDFCILILILYFKLFVVVEFDNLNQRYGNLLFFHFYLSDILLVYVGQVYIVVLRGRSSIIHPLHNNISCPRVSSFQPGQPGAFFSPHCPILDGAICHLSNLHIRNSIVFLFSVVWCKCKDHHNA